MRIPRMFLLTLAAFCCQFIVNANDIKRGPGDSIVVGSIIDTDSKKPIGEVTVSLSSGKQQFRRELRTDASGTFIFPQMPPGEFTLQLEKKGYKTYTKQYVMVKEGLSLKLSLEPKDEDSGIDTWNPLRMLYGK